MGLAGQADRGASRIFFRVSAHIALCGVQSVRFRLQCTVIGPTAEAEKERLESERARAGGSGGQAARPGGSTPEASSREAELRELVRRVKSGGAREGDLLRYIELQGGLG